MGNIIQIDGSTQLVSHDKFLCRRIIGRKHDFLAGEAACFTHHQLSQGGAVSTAALFLQNLQDARIRSCFYSKIFFKSLVPGKSRIQPACILTDALFIIQMDRGRILLDNFLCLFFGDKWSLLVHCSNILFCICIGLQEKILSPAVMINFLQYAPESVQALPPCRFPFPQKTESPEPPPAGAVWCGWSEDCLPAGSF